MSSPQRQPLSPLFRVGLLLVHCVVLVAAGSAAVRHFGAVGSRVPSWMLVVLLFAGVAALVVDACIYVDRYLLERSRAPAASSPSASVETVAVGVAHPLPSPAPREPTQ